MAKVRPLGPQSATQNRVRPWAPQRHTPSALWCERRPWDGERQAPMSQDTGLPGLCPCRAGEGPASTQMLAHARSGADPPLQATSLALNSFPKFQMPS